MKSKTWGQRNIKVLDHKQLLSYAELCPLWHLCKISGVIYADTVCQLLALPSNSINQPLSNPVIFMLCVQETHTSKFLQI